MIIILFFIGIALLFAWTIPEEEVNDIRKTLNHMKNIPNNTKLD